MSWLENLPDFAYCAELLLAVMLYWLPLEKKRRWPLWLLTGVAILLLESWIAPPLFARLGVHLWFYLVFLTLLGVCMSISKVSVWEALYCVSLGYFTQHLASSIYLLLAQMGLLPEPEVLLPLIYLAIYIVIYALSYFLIARDLAVHGHYEASRQLSVLVTVASLLVVYLLSIFTRQLADFFQVDTQTPSYGIMLGICQIYAVLVCVLTLASQKLQQNEFRAWKQLEMNQTIWNQKKSQYQFARENMELMNRKFHDMKHQIAAISQMDASSHRKDTLVRELQEIVQGHEVYVDTGNEALDTILMEKGLYCNMHDIQWKCVADGSFLGFMDVVDLYTLIGNALDNAVESVERIEDTEKRFISVSIRQEKGFALMRISNPVEGELTFRNGLPMTRKADAWNHGYGLRSMKAIAEKYQGDLSVRLEEGNFVLSLLIPIPA